MKKNIFLLFLLGLIIQTNAQWEKRYFVDDFGEKTESSYELLVADGTFSNSATTNSEATYYFIDYGLNEDGKEGFLQLNVYEYKSRLANSIESTREYVQIKTPSGEVVIIKRVYFNEEGYLIFRNKKYDKLKEAIKDSGNYIMIFDKKGKYSRSSYKIKFTID